MFKDHQHDETPACLLHRSPPVLWIRDILVYVCICILGMCTVVVCFSVRFVCMCFVFVRLGRVCREFGVFGTTGVV
jgi:hypothetical protein